MTTGSQRINRLRWQCRRGMKELDVLLENFLAREENRLLAGNWPELEDFLQVEDDQLWDWLQTRKKPDSVAYRELIDAIRG